MTKATDPVAADRTLTTTRVFDAPRAQVFKAWTDPKQFAKWFPPDGFTAECELDVRPGGSIRVDMKGADPALGPDFYDKVFFKNTHATISLTAAVVAELTDPSGLIAFALAAALNDSTNNGGGTRLTHTGGLTFNSSSKNVPSGQVLAAGDRIGVWLKLSLAAGQVATLTSYVPQLQGQTT